MGNYTYTNDYDPIGNRLQSTVNSGQLSVTNIYISNNLNQYSSILNSQFSIPYSLSHDEDGNMTWNGRKTLSYDAENRLSSAAPNYWGITNGATRTDYIYDYMNRRISKTTSVMSGRTIGFPPSPLDPQGTWSELETRKFIYDGWNVIAELVSTNTSSFSPHSSSFYVWGLDLSGTVQGAGGVGGLLSETKTTDSSSNTYFVYSDANGNITEYIDHEGIVKAHYEYNAFGEATYKSGTMKDDFAFRFSSKYFDPETGFYYYGERYYDPILDRWLSRDPITEDGGLNLYAHTQNNPVNRVDTDGRASYPTWGQTPLKTQIINNHYEKLRKKLINELKGLCPKNKVDEWEHPLKTTGSKYTKKYTLCCNRSDCLKEATSIANS